jgi:hypothetical protein
MSSVNTGGLFATGLLLPALGVVAIGVRYTARNRREYGFEMDDYLCIPAGLMLMACGIIVMVGAGQEVLGQLDTKDHDTTDDIALQQVSSLRSLH